MPELTESVCAETLFPSEAGKLIAANSNHVTISSKAIEVAAAKISQSFMKKESSMKTWKEHTLHPSVADEKAIDLIFVADTLNFSFWPDDPEIKYMVKYKGTTYTGYWSLIAALRRAQDEGKPVFNASYMSTVTEEEFTHLFRSDSKTDIALLKERYLAYKDAGKILLEDFDGSFVNCIKQCNKNAMDLLQCVVKNFISYRDVSTFDGKSVAFYKRAQILVADVWLCFEGTGLGEFTNIDQLTMFADYRVPQTLEYLEILSYSSELKKILEDLTVLPVGSRYELEIRGCSIEAVKLLVTQVKSAIMESDQSDRADISAVVNSITVDNYLWDYARAHRAEMAHLPFHRVRTIFY